MEKYKFTWDLIGGIEEGRESLGTQTDVAVYRLMQFTLRDVLEQELGSDAADRFFYAAGQLAGKEFYENVIAPVSSMDEFVGKVQQAFEEKKIGLLRIESVADDEIMLSIDEDLDCSGLAPLDFETCVYDEGLIGALFEAYTGTKWTAREIDCWCTGARTCRFLVKPEEESE